MDYKQFRTNFDFIYLSGLKGQERVCEIQDKKTNKMYDYKEVIQQSDGIDAQIDLCDKILTLSHPNILKLVTYSYCLLEETHGDPYCKFFLVFEYSESSLDREIQTLLKKRTFMKTQKLIKIFGDLFQGLQYLHSHGIVHGKLNPESICVTEKDDYKIVPQIKIKMLNAANIDQHKNKVREIYKARKKNYVKESKSQLLNLKNEKEKKKRDGSTENFIVDRNYPSPEVYINSKNREGFNKLAVDKFSSELFSLGMMLLSVGLLENLEYVYKTFSLDAVYLHEKVLRFEELHGRRLTAILMGLLCSDPTSRNTIEKSINLLKDDEEIDLSTFKYLQEAASPRSPRSPYSNISPKSKASPRKRRFLSSDFEQTIEKSLLEKLFNTLPQEYQDEIDKRVSAEIKNIEEQKYPVEMYISGNRYQGQKKIIDSCAATPLNLHHPLSPLSPKLTLIKGESSPKIKLTSGPNTMRVIQESPTILLKNIKKVGSPSQFSNPARNISPSNQSFSTTLLPKNTKQVSNQSANPRLNRKAKQKKQKQRSPANVNTSPNPNPSTNTNKGLSSEWSKLGGVPPSLGMVPVEKKVFVPHGWGVFWLANGERYEGQFENGKYHGEGIYYWPTGVKHYGQFVNGEITGVGVRYDGDGGIYYGQWVKGKNHGKGTYFWSTGAKYQGGFIEDMIYGKGVLTWPEEDLKTVRHYEGLWKDVNPKGITVEQIKQGTVL